MRLLLVTAVMVMSSVIVDLDQPEDVMVIIVPKQAVDIVKKFEGLRLTPYKDAVGKPTVGYGHFNLTPPPCDGCTIITKEQADGMLNNDLEYVITKIHGMVGVDLTDNQISALASFAFNLGLHNLQSSTLLKEVNNGNFNDAADEFLKWDHAGGIVLDGLAKRRVAERELFLTPDMEDSDVVATN